MSIPGPPPRNPYNPYQQPSGSTPGAPGGTPNPYAQPPGQVPQQPFGASPFGAPPGAQVPPTPGSPRKPVPGWLWGLGGVLVASAVWAGTLFATGGFPASESPDLAGYEYTEDLGSAVELSAFLKEYEKKDPTGAGGTEESDYGSEQDAFDQSYSLTYLTDPDASSTEYASIWVTSQARWNKKADPALEFSSNYLSYKDQQTDSYKYEVEKYKELGDEAYLVTTRSGKEKEFNSMTMGVREGWFTFEMRFSYYSGSDAPEVADVKRMLTSDARATLEKLKA